MVQGTPQKWRLDIESLATTTTLIAPAGNLPLINVTLSALTVADVEGIVPTGTVSFYEGSLFLGIGSLDGSGNASCVIDSWLAGPHLIHAVYSGSADFMVSTSTVQHVTAVALRTTTVLTVRDATHFAGEDVTLQAAVSSNGNPILGGTVQFYDGSILLGNGTLDGSGDATFTLSEVSAGTHSFSAVFMGSVAVLTSRSVTISDILVTPTIIDLLVVYTANASEQVGSIESVIEQSVAETNLAMVNSQIPVVIRLVHEQEVSYTESGNYSTDIGRLSNPTDGYLDDVAALRSQYHADLVSLFVGGMDSIHDDIGLGNELNNSSGNYQAAYTVVDAAYSVDDYVLAHELGHNLGARHDTQNDDNSSGFQNGHGYRFIGQDGVQYHDIMSYDPGQLIPYYSNPSVTFEGVPEGTAQANSAGVIRENAGTVANYSNFLPGISGATQPEGSLDAITDGVITGWGFDANAGVAPVQVRIDIDNVAGSPFRGRRSRGRNWRASSVRRTMDFRRHCQAFQMGRTWLLCMWRILRAIALYRWIRRRLSYRI